MGNSDSSQRGEAVNYLCIGKSGNGKSSTLNSLTRDEVFLINKSTTAGTKKPGFYSTRIDGVTLNIVDTPGLCHPDIPIGLENVRFARNNMCEAFQLIKDKGINHFDALILVLSYIQRFTHEEQTTIEYLKTIFGQSFIKNNCIIVMTHGDNYAADEQTKKFNSFNNWCRHQEGTLRNLFNECNFRVVLFNNRGNAAEKNKSSSELFSFTRQIRLKYFTHDFYKQEEQRKKMLLTFCLDDLKKEFQSLLQLLNEDLDLIRSPREILVKLTKDFQEKYADCVKIVPTVHDLSKIYTQGFEQRDTRVNDFESNLKNNILHPSIKSFARLYTAFDKLKAQHKLLYELKVKTDLLLREIQNEDHGTDKLKQVENQVLTFQRKLNNEA